MLTINANVAVNEHTRQSCKKTSRSYKVSKGLENFAILEYHNMLDNCLKSLLDGFYKMEFISGPMHRLCKGALC